MALTIISINVNGLRGPSKRAGFLLHSLPCIPDIVCLQEAHCMSSEEWWLVLLFWFIFCGVSSIHELVWMYRLVSSCFVASLVLSDSNGRFLLYNFSFCDVPFRVACVYAPNYVPERDNFLVTSLLVLILQFLLLLLGILILCLIVLLIVWAFR